MHEWMEKLMEGQMKEQMHVPEIKNPHFILFFCGLGTTTRDTQGLLLVKHSEITLGKVSWNIWSARNWPWVNGSTLGRPHARQITLSTILPLLPQESLYKITTTKERKTMVDQKLVQWGYVYLSLMPETWLFRFNVNIRQMDHYSIWGQISSLVPFV